MNYNREIVECTFFLTAAVSIFILLSASPADAASMDCEPCHVGVAAVNPRDTLSGSACFTCHDSDYPPEYSSSVHLIHSGQISIGEEALRKHPKKATGDCKSCHQPSSECKSCHLSMPHVSSRRECQNCHGTLTGFFEHSIKLEKHDILKSSNCTLCHPSDKRFLTTARGLVPISQPHRLCYQCHNDIYRDWSAGAHFVNITRAGENWQLQYTCTVCHDPHVPSKLLMSDAAAEKVEKESTPPVAHLALISSFSFAVIAMYFAAQKVRKKK